MRKLTVAGVLALGLLLTAGALLLIVTSDHEEQPATQVVPEAIPQPRHIEPETRPGQRPVPHPMPPPEQHVGVFQQPPAEFARFATPVNHRLEISAEVRPAILA